ncbi:hypothetical protein [Sandaracinobacteroides saxicola]|uniref:hypothetical protein n=1 Tax=Sandaracinobacteroides saxicola TaxID=2759707 RepID=UPI001FB10D93|nr:hypothetical protein [Sandaracinobacteroides saxicola]
MAHAITLDRGMVARRRMGFQHDIIVGMATDPEQASGGQRKTAIGTLDRRFDTGRDLHAMSPKAATRPNRTTIEEQHLTVIRPFSDSTARLAPVRISQNPA